MNLLIIEDEFLAADRLEQLLQRCLPEGRVVAKLPSVRSSVSWLKENSSPDLIFMDIQLSDGISFEIFEQITVSSPIIFTTAYDAYALKAFKVNSVDYILKPLDADELEKGVEKWKANRGGAVVSEALVKELMQVVKPESKKRFLVKYGAQLKSIEIHDVLYFYSKERTTFLLTKTGRSFVYEEPLDRVMEQLDTEQFFRINRQYICSIDSISDMYAHSNSRIKLKLMHCEDGGVIVSRDRVAVFKKWLGQ